MGSTLLFMTAGCYKCNSKTHNNDSDDSNKNVTRITQLGANFNENIDEIAEVSQLLHDSKVEWIRAFVNIPQEFLKSNNQTIIGVKEEALNEYTQTLDFMEVKKTSNGNVKLIMSLKIPFGNFTHNVPSVDSKEMTYVFEACRRFLILHDLGKHIDILVMGNEPMWENGDECDANVNNYKVFINALADKLIEWKKEYNWQFKVFAGSLNRIALHVSSNKLIPAVISEVNSNPNIDGLDIHLHEVKTEDIGKTLAILRDDFKVTKEIIATEFSMVWVYDRHKNKKLGQWGVEHNYPADMKMYEWLNNAIELAKQGTPISSKEFASFFESKEWYPRNWFKTFYEQFEKYNVYCATGRFSCVLKEYGASRGKYGATSTMWDLNSIFSSKLLGVDPTTGFMNKSPLVYPDFKEIMDRKFRNNKIIR